MEGYRPYSRVNLPSEGKYYTDRKSFFYVRYLSYEEEYILTDESIMSNGDGIRKVLESVIVDNFDVSKLVPGDVQAISMFLRSTAFGDKLDLHLTCPKCKHTQEVSKNISSFQMKEVETMPDEGNMFNLVLPNSKHQIKMRIPTFVEEVEAETEGKNGFVNKLGRIITQIGKEKDTRVIKSLVPNMPIQDSRYLKEFLEKNTPGVKTEVGVICEKCAHEYHQKFSTDHNFLKLPENYRQSMMQQLFNIAYNSQGGISWTEAVNMPTVERVWVMNKLKEVIDEQNRKIKAPGTQNTVNRNRFRR